VAAVKRLIGRKFTDDVVKKDMGMVSYKIIKADNGDAWVEVQGKKMAPQEISARVLQKNEKDRRGLSGRDRHRGGHHGYRRISTIRSARPPRMPGALRA